MRGGAGGIGGKLRNIRLGISSAMGGSWLSLKTPKAIEIGLSTQKAGWDGGISVNEPSINMSTEYKKMNK